MPASIELYLIRHAIAADRGDNWPDDSKRPLTESGASRFARAVRGLTRIGLRVDVILTSPYVRTRQTAELLAAGLPDHPPVVPVESLAPGGTPAAVFDDLSRKARRSRVALVGHEPDLGQLAAKLIGARRPLAFKKGAVCRIDVEAVPPGRPGELRWFVPPRLLRRVDGG